VNPKLSDKEIKTICDDAEAKILFVDKASYITLENIVFSTVEKIVVIENELEDWIMKASPLQRVRLLWNGMCSPCLTPQEQQGNPKGF